MKLLFGVILLYAIRFDSLGELVYEIYQTIHKYNNRRIHAALKMPPLVYANQFLIAELVSNKMGTWQPRFFLYLSDLNLMVIVVNILHFVIL